MSFFLFSTNPLVSTLVTLYTLNLLYFPTFFLRIVLSPVLICTGILLLALLRLGSSQRIRKEKEISAPEPQQARESVDGNFVSLETSEDSEKEAVDRKDDSFSVDSFVEWNVRAPLEAIYEEYDEDDEESNDGGFGTSQFTGLQRYASLSQCFPETDSDTSSEDDFPMFEYWKSSQDNIGLIWDEEDRDGLIEIALDGKTISSEADIHYVEFEDNMIEIDISPARKDRFLPFRQLTMINES